MASSSLRIALANDYAIVIEGLAAMFEPYRDRITVVDQTLDDSVHGQVDLILLDTFGVADIAARIAQAQGTRSLPVVIFAWDFDPAAVTEALHAGAWGFLSKQMGAADLARALEQVHAGEVFVPPPRAESSTNETACSEPPASPSWAQGDWPGRAQGLSAREAHVLAFIADGMSNDDIARITYLSINTVKSYIRTLYQKIDAASRSQAVLWAIDHGLGTPQSRAHFNIDPHDAP